MTMIGMHEAKTRLSQLVERAEAGEEVVISRRGRPVAKLVAIEQPSAGLGSVRGALAGQVQIADDFEELPPELAEAFGL